MFLKKYQESVPMKVVKMAHFMIHIFDAILKKLIM